MSSGLTDPSSNAEGSPAEAHDVLRRYGKSFHFASLVLDRATAERCARLYAFCRHVDDLADAADDREVARERLQAVIRMLGEGRAADPVVADFLQLADSVDMPVEPAVELVKGVMLDLSDVRMNNVAELHRYCYRVAGTVGLMMCGMLGVDDPRAYPFAIDLGIGMQMTNIARDVREDAEAGRRYLPASVIGEVSPAALAKPDDALKERTAGAVQWLLDEADHYYRSGEAGLVYLPARSRLCIRIASRVYHRIGVRIRGRNFTVWEGRAVVPLWEKLAAGLVAAKEHVTSLWRAGEHPLHSHALHRWLQGLTGASRAPTIV